MIDDGVRNFGDALDVYRVNLIPIRLVRSISVLPPLGSDRSRIVDHNIHLPKHIHDLPYHLVDRRLVGNVHGDRESPPSQRADLLGGRLCITLTHVRNYDVRPVLSKDARDRPSYSPTRPGNDSYLVRNIHLLPPWHRLECGDAASRPPACKHPGGTSRMVVICAPSGA